MSKARSSGIRATEPPAGSGKRWSALTWDDLEQWAGHRSVERGRSYERKGRVRNLAVSDEGKLLATVQGGERYVVSAWLHDRTGDGAPLESLCTCPVGADGCKHAVAVVAAYLDALGGGTEVPPADPDDPRWKKLDRDAAEEWDEDEEEDEAPARRRALAGRPRQDWDQKIKAHIDAKGREELAALVWSLTQRFAELRDEFRERIALGEGDVDRLVAQARKELRQVTSQEAWRNYWTGEGNVPEYGKLLHRLERLLEMGHADAVAGLAPEIIERGTEQVGRSDDEGDTAYEFGRLLPIVFTAVARSGMTPPQKLLLAIDALLQDDYDVIGDAAGAVLDAPYTPSDWSAVADELIRRLPQREARRRPADGDDDEEGDDFSRNYHRDQLTRWLITTLNNAGRGEEVPAIYEREARVTGSYERLVRFLIEQKSYDEAQRWAAEGIEKTADKLPGIASNLASQLCELARHRRQWDLVAAHVAVRFFEQPGRSTFEELVAAAAKAGVEEPVRRLALQFLQTGVAPLRVVKAKKGLTLTALPEWPLPVPAELAPLLRPDERRPAATQPHYEVLIDLAIAAKRPDEVLRWYDQMRAQPKRTTYGGPWWSSESMSDQVADAVAESHPQRALEIYQRKLDQNLTHASASAYQTAASYLRRMRPIMNAIDRGNDWKQLVEEIRVRHRNRPKLLETLDRLDDRPIIASSKRRRH